MRGRIPKDDAIKIAEGTFRADRVKIAPVCASLLATPPDPPAHLHDTGKRIWREVCEFLIERNRLDRSYLHAIELYCDAWERREQAWDECSGQWVLECGEHGFPMLNPLLSIAHKAEALITKLQEQFGLTALSHQRCGSTATPTKTGVPQRKRG